MAIIFLINLSRTIGSSSGGDGSNSDSGFTSGSPKETGLNEVSGTQAPSHHESSEHSEPEGQKALPFPGKLLVPCMVTI